MALGGGFSRASLGRFAQQGFAESSRSTPYADLFARKISPELAERLSADPDATSLLARSFFGSSCFAPERWLLATCVSNHELPATFLLNESFLLWKCVAKTPQEIIFEWQAAGCMGYTQLAFDPAYKKVFHGNSLPSKVVDTSAFQAILPFHTQYAQWLADCMVRELESQVKN
jgi:hypothetical protein